MRKTILTLVGTAIIAAAGIQAAAAAERHHVRNTDKSAAPLSQSVRDSNASIAYPQTDAGRYQNGGWSAPAGR